MHFWFLGMWVFLHISLVYKKLLPCPLKWCKNSLPWLFRSLALLESKQLPAMTSFLNSWSLKVGVGPRPPLWVTGYNLQNWVSSGLFCILYCWVLVFDQGQTSYPHYMLPPSKNSGPSENSHTEARTQLGCGSNMQVNSLAVSCLLLSPEAGWHPSLGMPRNSIVQASVSWVPLSTILFSPIYRKMRNTQPVSISRRSDLQWVAIGLNLTWSLVVFY